MSAGSNLQEMEVSTKKSVTAVNKGAKPAEGQGKLAAGAVAGQSGSWEDLGGPTPFNSRSTDDSNKLRTPGTTLKQVANVVTKNAKAGDKMPSPIVGKQASYGEESEFEYDEEILEAKDEEVEEDEEKEDDEEKSEKGKKKVKEEYEDDDEELEFDFSEDVQALGLSEEFRDKAALIFETAVRTKISEIKESLENKFNVALVEEVSAIKEELTERVDSYLEYVSEEWIDENSLQIESGLKNELSESFMSGLKSLFEEHYVSIPEEKYDVLENMVMRLDEMEEKLNEQIERNVQLNKRLSEAVSETIFNEVTEGLALTQKEKLAGLAESVEFESEKNYRGKLETLKESYFSRTTGSVREEMLIQENVEDYSPQMSAYLKAVSKFSK